MASCSAASIDGVPGRTTTLTLASLLGEVRRNLSGYVQTFVFVQVAGLASFVAWMLVTLVTLGVLAAVDAYAGRTPAGRIRTRLLGIASPLHSDPCRLHLRLRHAPGGRGRVGGGAWPACRGRVAARAPAHARRQEGGAGHAARAAVVGAKQGGLEDVRGRRGAGAG